MTDNLRPKFEEMVAKANERGYTLTMHSGDYTQGTLTHPVYNGALMVHPGQQQFEFVYMTRKGALTLSSGKLGSFDSDEHFSKHLRLFHEAAFALHLGFERD